jgi:hypothetical protein
MRLACKLLPVWSGHDENVPTDILKLRHRSHLYLTPHPWQVLRRALKATQLQQVFLGPGRARFSNPPAHKPHAGGQRCPPPDNNIWAHTAHTR